MALSLFLRNATKVSGYSCLFRGSSIVFKNTQNLSLASNKAIFNATKCLTPWNSTKQNSIVPNTRGMASDHRMMWTVERVFAIALLPILPLTVMMPNDILDNVTAVMVVLHTHWGIESIVVDYIRPIIFGDLIPKLSFVAVYLLSAITLGGLLYFNYTDIGLGAGIRKMWSIKSE